MRTLPWTLSALAVPFLSLAACSKTAGGPQTQLTAATSAKSASDAPKDVDFPCLNPRVFWGLLTTGNVDCKVATTINFRDGDGKPKMGAIFQLQLETYLHVPVGSWVKQQLSAVKKVKFPDQTVVVKAQLADDPDQKKLVSAKVRMAPSVTYSSQGLCSVKIMELSLDIDEVSSPDLGDLAGRIGGIAQNMVDLYKDGAIQRIQASVDAFSNSKYCWYYRWVFHHEDLKAQDAPVQPSESEKAAAKAQVADAPAPDNADALDPDAQAWIEQQNEKFSAGGAK